MLGIPFIPGNLRTKKMRRFATASAVLMLCLFIVLQTGFVAFAQSGPTVALHDGDARSFTDPPDVVAYANTQYASPPPEFVISGAWQWDLNEWVAFYGASGWIEAQTTVATTSVGVQFWGDTNDGWARVLVDGSEVWTGNTYGADAYSPGQSFVKYLDISGLVSTTHTIRVESMGISGDGGGDWVTVLFFGLGEVSEVSPTPTPATGAGLVAYYPFDGDATDHSGNGNHGTNNGASFVTGISGQAVSLDGTNDYVSSPVNINPDIMPQMTVTLWAQADAVTGTVFSHDNGGYDRTIDIDNRGGGTGWSAFSGSGGVLGYHPVTVGEWVFIAAVYDQDAGTVKLYVNDSMYEETGSLGSGWDAVNIGSSPSFGAYFPGTIDEVRIYSYALSSGEISALYGGGVPPTPSPTPIPSPTQTPTPTATPTAAPGTPPAPTPSPISTPTPSGAQRLIFESRSKPAGSSVQIPLTLQGVQDRIGNMDLVLSYDPSILEATQVTKGDLTANSLFVENIQNGTIRISLVDSQGFGGDGSVAIVTFNVIGAKGSTSPLTIMELSANRVGDAAVMSIEPEDGIFRVFGGDCNGDGEITVVDALCALQMAVGKREVDLLMDVNGDGKVSSIDARMILRYSLGLEVL